MEEEAEYCCVDDLHVSYNVLLMGDGGVGKSMLYKQIIHISETSKEASKIVNVQGDHVKVI